MRTFGKRQTCVVHDVAHAVGEFLYMATKNLQDKACLLVLNKGFWSIFGESLTFVMIYKMSYFDRI